MNSLANLFQFDLIFKDIFHHIYGKIVYCESSDKESKIFNYIPKDGDVF
jgi:hypothetical protein